MVCKLSEKRRSCHGPWKMRRSRHASPYAHPPRSSCIGGVLNKRYEVLGLIGKGTTAKVLEAYDMETNSMVVIKIQKHEDYHYVMREVQILETIARRYEHQEITVVRLLDWFMEREIGICLVFEKGVCSLWNHMQKKQAAFCLHDIQQFGRQILSAVAQFHRLGITHADFKPENLVFFPREGHE